MELNSYRYNQILVFTKTLHYFNYHYLKSFDSNLAGKSFFFFLYIALWFSVYGPTQAAPHACKTPTRPDLPAACATEEGPSIHFRPDALPGAPLGPQVHCGCHRLSCYG